jgi:hypothetical protein
MRGKRKKKRWKLFTTGSHIHQLRPVDVPLLGLMIIRCWTPKEMIEIGRDSIKMGDIDLRLNLEEDRKEEEVLLPMSNK